MLKGINKQIIEIKCPESEHFEKILLFVKSENGVVPVTHLGAEIYEYYSNLVGGEFSTTKKYKSRTKKLWLFIILSIIGSGLLGLLSVLLIL